jgi:post-segregation antitoxin (ccd killing protein)
MCHIVTRQPKAPEPPVDPERKERVIHTRVPEYLESELRERAQALGISVSNLVRNVLGNAFGLVGEVAADLDAMIARAASAATGTSGGATSGDRSRAKGADAKSGATVGSADAPAPIDDVLAWQPMVLGKNAVCARCNEILPRGQDAAIGLTEHGGARVIVCSSCLQELRK